MEARLDEELKVLCLDGPVDLLVGVVGEPGQAGDVDAGGEGLGGHCGRLDRRARVEMMGNESKLGRKRNGICRIVRRGEEVFADFAGDARYKYASSSVARGSSTPQPRAPSCHHRGALEKVDDFPTSRQFVFPHGHDPIELSEGRVERGGGRSWSGATTWRENCSAISKTLATIGHLPGQV